jgi:hypothetical protein
MDSFPYVLIIYVDLFEDDDTVKACKGKLLPEVEINLTSQLFNCDSSTVFNVENSSGSFNSNYSKLVVLQ